MRFAFFAFALAAAALAALALARVAVPDQPPPAFATVTLGGTRLAVPGAVLRFADQRMGGALDHIDVALGFPDFGSVPERPTLDATVFSRVTAADLDVDPSDRPTRLYARFLEPDRWTEPGGLVMVRFAKGGPYDDEQLYLAPPEGRAFWARCHHPPDTADDLPDTCLSAFRVATLDVSLRFSPALLPHWPSLVEGVRRVLGEWQR